MTRVAVLAAVSTWVGTTLVLSQLRWFGRVPAAERLRAYVPGGMSAPSPVAAALSGDSFMAVMAPLARSVGDAMARIFGVNEDLAVRLERIHAPVDVTGFRVRQLGWAIGGFLCGAAVAAIAPVPFVVAMLFVVSGPLLAYLLLEQRTATASTTWQRRLFLELPVVSEQLAMLLSAGYSLGSALNRLAGRGRGVCSRDLTRVGRRIRQGVGDVDALREWAAVARVDALDRLVAVLALHREAADLGRLLSQEARVIRHDVQRDVIDRMERRGQQVWVPVTVAALVPGALLLAVPFIEAMRLFSTS